MATDIFGVTDVGVSVDPDLLEIAQRAPRSTLCLTTALAQHGLTDEIPAAIDVALPRGQHRPATTAPVRWHLFDWESFDVGRTKMPLDETTSIGLYGPERSIIDAIRLRHQEGPELGYNALKRWLARPGAMPSDAMKERASAPRDSHPRATLGLFTSTTTREALWTSMTAGSLSG